MGFTGQLVLEKCPHWTHRANFFAFYKYFALLAL